MTTDIEILYQMLIGFMFLCLPVLLLIIILERYSYKPKKPNPSKIIIDGVTYYWVVRYGEGLKRHCTYFYDEEPEPILEKFLWLGKYEYKTKKELFYIGIDLTDQHSDAYILQHITPQLIAYKDSQKAIRELNTTL